MDKLRLARPKKKHRKRALEYLGEVKEWDLEIHGAGEFAQYEGDYDGWLKRLAADRTQEPNEERVPGETFFLMKTQITPSDGSNLACDGHHSAGTYFHQDEKVIGLLSVRLALNDELWRYGGHISYNVRPSERGRGYGKVLLYSALKICQQHSIKVTLLNCDKNNLASAKTIRALDGKLISEHRCRNSIGKTILNQWYTIDVDTALAKYADQYGQLMPRYPD